MRTTRATAAVERLKQRSANPHYKMMLNSGGLPYLVLDEGGSLAPQCEAMPLDDFVTFVNAFGPKVPQRISKYDLAFEAQLAKRKKPP